MADRCSCGCGSVTTLTRADAECGCGCSCCGDAPKTRDEEIAELVTLRGAIERRLEELKV
ncbi:MAG: hypothetical protein ACRD0D_14645 [Acidimicrobiales bacterium]